MKEQLLEAWQINNEKNLLLIHAISDTGMQVALSSRGGRTILQQWIHIHNVRLQWLEITAKDIYSTQQLLDKDTAYNKKDLQQALKKSASALAELFSRSWDEGGKIKGFKKGLIPLFAYLISHESHHRGNILLSLKQKGEKIPDSAKWGIWEWGK